MRSGLASLILASLLVAFGALATIWVRSHWWCDEWRWVQKPGMFAVVCRPGRVIFHGDDADHLTLDEPPPALGFSRRVVDPRTAEDWPVDSEPDWRHAGFAWTRFTSSDWLKTHVWELEVPLAVPAGVFLVPAAMMIVLHVRRKRQRRRSRLCLRCGYDLRASVGRCPECGTPVPSD